MLTTKVTYQTAEGRIFKTIVPTRENVQQYMDENYDTREMTILSTRPSVKAKYKRWVNK